MDTHTTKLSALAMVLLVLVSFTVAMGFAGGASLQEAGNAGNAGPATVSFSEQTTAGETVTVDSVNVSDGGFVAIHDSGLLDGNVVGSVIGVSEYLEPGEHEDVEIALFEVSGAEFDQSELSENDTLIAMPHRDTNGNETYDFVSSNGTADGPYVANGSAVTDAAAVTVTSTDAPVEGSSFVVSNLSAPSVVVQGDTVTVTATVTNPNAVTDTQAVEFRFGGDVVVRDRIELAGGNATTVSYSLNTSTIETGSYFHGVYTQTDGAPAQLLVVDEIQSFTVSNLSAPDTVTTGSEFTVTANVSNPNEFAIEQPVEFRFQGALVEERSVSIDAESTATVEFRVNTSDITPGTYIHDVFTRDRGQSALITIEELDEEPDEPEESEESEDADSSDESEQQTETEE